MWGDGVEWGGGCVLGRLVSGDHAHLLLPAGDGTDRRARRKQGVQHCLAAPLTCCAVVQLPSPHITRSLDPTAAATHTPCSPAPSAPARFEEPGGANIISHPRVIEGTVRKEESKRKRQREAKKQRQAAEEEERRTEVKRLKNEKRRDIEDRLSKLQQVGRSSAGHCTSTRCGGASMLLMPGQQCATSAMPVSPSWRGVQARGLLCTCLPGCSRR